MPSAAKASVTADISRLPSPPSEAQARVSKRNLHPDAELPPKKRRHCHATPPSGTREITPEHDRYGAPVRWEEYFDAWPAQSKMSDHRAAKRSRTPSQSNSFTQSVRDGKSPAAWTPQHEEKMREAGVFMTDFQTQVTISDDCQRLCSRLCEAEYSLPSEPAFQPDRLVKMLGRVQLRTEARVVRDVTPIVVPSPELLYIDGHSNLGNICEAMNAEWTRCDTLGGPRPRPDFVAGIAASSFTDEERKTLCLHHTSACPNLFPENMYFPFLICEVKGCDSSVKQAERQAMHSASIAVQAIIRLYQKFSAGEELNRKILAFSIAHDASMVNIFGHFADIKDDKISFFRHQVYSLNFATNLTSYKWAKAYKITRAIYDVFLPEHLERIRSALSRLPAPSLSSFTSQLGLGEGSQASTPISSQDDGLFKKPELPATARLQQENDSLRELMEQQLAQQKELMMEQLVQQKEESRELMKQQLAQQKELMMEQLAQQKEESREQKTIMERQMAQQKEQMEQQMGQQKEQMEQQREIIQLLKESKSK